MAIVSLLVTASVPPLAYAQGPGESSSSNPDVLPPRLREPGAPATVAAKAVIKEMRQRLLDTRDKQENYGTEDLDQLFEIYWYGSDDPVTQKLYLREQVLALYRDMLWLDRRSREDAWKVKLSNAERVATFLSDEDAALLRAHITEYLQTAFDDLLLPQRARLLFVARHVLTAEDETALDTLSKYAKDPDLFDDERSDIEDSIDQIIRGGPIASDSDAVSAPD